MMDVVCGQTTLGESEADVLTEGWRNISKWILYTSAMLTHSNISQNALCMLGNESKCCSLSMNPAQMLEPVWWGLKMSQNLSGSLHRILTSSWFFIYWVFEYVTCVIPLFFFFFIWMDKYHTQKNTLKTQYKLKLSIFSLCSRHAWAPLRPTLNFSQLTHCQSGQIISSQLFLQSDTCREFFLQSQIPHNRLKTMISHNPLLVDLQLSANQESGFEGSDYSHQVSIVVQLPLKKKVADKGKPKPAFH